MTTTASKAAIRGEFPTETRLIPVRVSLTKPKADLAEAIGQALKSGGLELADGDILAVASKLVSMAEGRLVNLGNVIPSREAAEMSERYRMDPRLVEVIIGEADHVLGGLPGVLLTLKDGVLAANAGVDASNTPMGYVSLWPSDPQRSADELREALTDNVRPAVLIVDSRVTPLRLGTTGLALAVSGFEPTMDLRGLPDLYGKTLSYTWHSIADDLASAAHFLMGEADEGIPAVIVRGSRVPFEDGGRQAPLKMPPDSCIFMNTIYKQGFSS